MTEQLTREQVTVAPTLGVVLGSIRSARVGDKVAAWFLESAQRHTGFGIDFIDLADLRFPVGGEPHHPATGNYEQPETRAWSARIAACDAYVLITPEYNHGYPGVLKSALDMLFWEWADKGVAFVSYGGVSGGVRAVEQLKAVTSTLGMVSITNGVVVPLIASRIDGDRFVADDLQDHAASALLDELVSLTSLLGLRRSASNRP